MKSDVQTGQVGKEKGPCLAELVIHTEGMGMCTRKQQGDAEAAVEMEGFERKADVE